MKLQEMDLDGLLADPPALALVDELAHSNVPGSRHAKRWQDIQELLAAGIDVYTTVNVQHLESLNDQVRDITGVQVRETVPDWALRRPTRSSSSTCTPRELLERLREGKVYVPEQARAAIDAFFSQTNLTALRELAMQTAAARVDADLNHRYRQRGEEAPALRGRLLVGIDGDEQAERPGAPRLPGRRTSAPALERGTRRYRRLARRAADAPAGCAATGRAARRRDRRAARRRGGADPPATCPRAPRQPGPGWPVAAPLVPPAFGGGLAGRLLRDGQGLEISALTARPTCARRNRGHAIRWCGTTICWRCWRPPWPAAWPGSWRTCWSCRTSPWCS